MHSEYLELALVQTKPRKGPVAANRDALRALLLPLQAAPPDVILLPEAALTGYFLEGATLECALTREEIADELAGVWRSVSSAPVEFVCGFYEQASGVVYNSAIAVAITSDTLEILHVHRKLFLPTYGVFDEARFVKRGRRVRTYTGVRLPSAIAICEDAWHALVPTIAAMKGAQLLFVPSASPAREPRDGEFENLRQWEAILRGIAREHGMFVCYAGLTGFEGGKGMSGGSCVIDPSGDLVARASNFEAEVLRVRLDLADLAVARAALPLLGDLRNVWADLLRECDVTDA